MRPTFVNALPAAVFVVRVLLVALAAFSHAKKLLFRPPFFAPLLRYICMCVCVCTCVCVCVYIYMYTYKYV